MAGIDEHSTHEHVAILGWGSLIWNPPDTKLTDEDRLRVPGCWHSDGPALPLEFSHVGQDGRLMLAVDAAHGRNARVFYTLSGFTTVSEAVLDLQAKENLRRLEIQTVRKGEVTSDPVCLQVAQWLGEHHFDAAIWVALGNNFQEKTGRPFTVENALGHLFSLPGKIRDAAFSYIAKVPRSMDTLLRQKIRTPVLTPIIY